MHVSTTAPWLNPRPNNLHILHGDGLRGIPAMLSPVSCIVCASVIMSGSPCVFVCVIITIFFMSNLIFVIGHNSNESVTAQIESVAFQLLSNWWTVTCNMTPLTAKRETNCYPSLPHSCSYMGRIKVWEWQKSWSVSQPGAGALWTLRSSRQRLTDLQANSLQTCQSHDPGLFGLARVQQGSGKIQSLKGHHSGSWRWMPFHPQLCSQMWVPQTAVPSVTRQLICMD